MRKAFISWLALDYDFVYSGTSPRTRVGFSGSQGSHVEINRKGPTLAIHQQYPNRPYEQYYLLATHNNQDKVEAMMALLKQEYPGHKVIPQYIDLEDPYDYQELKIRMGKLLDSLEEMDQIDIMFSSGTTPMRVVWVLLYLERLDLGKISLYQGVAPRFSPTGRSAFRRVEFDASDIPQRIRNYELWARSQLLEDPELCPLPSLGAAYSRAERIASVDLAEVPGLTTLIEGPSGAGKKSLAEFLHRKSKWNKNAFIPVSCAAFDESRLYSQLFGHKAGTLPGSQNDQEGKFERAAHGTLYLDELSELSPQIQAALVRFLKDGFILPLGASDEIRVNTRLIMATSHSIEKLCAEGRLRKELYDLIPTRLELPALADYPAEERKQLFEFLLKKMAPRYGRKEALKLSRPVERQLLSYTFPGNIRELKKVFSGFYIYIDRDQVLPEDLPQTLQGPLLIDEDLSLDTAKKRHIIRVYEMVGRNKKQAEKLLKISYTTVLKVVKEFEEELSQD